MLCRGRPCGGRRWGCGRGTGRGEAYCAVGAEFLAAAGGGCYYYEVEVLEDSGNLYVGLAGTNLGPQCKLVGDDACSWTRDKYGYVRHGCVWGRRLRAF